MTIRDTITEAIAHRSDLNGMGLDAIMVEDLADEILASLNRDSGLAMTEAPQELDEAVLVYCGGFAAPAYPLSPLAANGAPTVDVWTSLCEPSLRQHLVAFDLEDAPLAMRMLVRMAERFT